MCEDERNLTSYDAELIEDFNDGPQNLSTQSDSLHESDDTIEIDKLSTFINVAQQCDHTRDIFDYKDTVKETTNTQTHVLHMRATMDDQGQMDSGANRNVTNDKNILRNYTDIKPIAVYGIGNEDAACHITGRGILALETMEGTYLNIIMYFSSGCSGTILSPTAIVRHNKMFRGWIQHSYVDTGQGYVTFVHRNNETQNRSIPLVLSNDLWYVPQTYSTLVTTAHKTEICLLRPYSDSGAIFINKLTKITEYELWHQRLMHPGHQCMSAISSCAIGVPKLHRHSLHNCRICKEMNVKKTSNKHVTPNSNVQRFGDRFQMDFGFMKGKHDNISLRSHDGYNSYLLIIDYYTRYLWIFLSKNKQPPLKVLHKFLRTYGQRQGIRTIRTDQGGELARSSAFQEAITEAGYSIEITGSDNSAQNGIAERPHQTLANMVRAGIENAGLHVKYWSDALLHAVYIKNRLPHKRFDYKYSPYEKLTGLKPDLRKLRVFGSRMVTRKPGRRSPKVSKHSYSGIFLRYAKTMNNIVYIDTNTNKIKTTTYGTFDEAHFSYPNKPPGAQILIELGLKEQSDRCTQSSNEVTKTPILEILKTSPNARIPTKGSADAAGYDLYSLNSYTILPHQIGVIDTGIATKFPPNTYGRVAGRSGLAINHSIDVKGGVIDPDYTGNIKIILHNFGDKPFQVQQHDRIAQLILEQYASSDIVLTESIRDTQRSKQGFGSSGIQTDTSKDTTNPQIIPHNDDEITPTIHRTDVCNNSVVEMVYTKPIFTTTITIQKRGTHPTLGLDMALKNKKICIERCVSGTPAAKTPRWRQILKGAELYSIDSNIIHTILDVRRYIAKRNTGTPIHFQIIPLYPTDIHPETGIPQINFDQFVHLCRTHQELLCDAIDIGAEHETDDTSKININKLDTNTLTRAKLMKRQDWDQWEASEFLQMDQYERQKMFGPPGPLPSKSVNILPMIWVYLVKTDGRKKARCVANGAAHFKGSITIANTYAACLEQAACRLFWSIVAMKNKKVYGSDAANAFAEAPPPKSPLYLKVDNAYINWWQKKTGQTLPADTYVQVLQAIQGHPESPRLWQLHIDKILSKIGFQSTTHEPCLYIKYTPTETLYMLRQVDDFAIACDDKRTAISHWDEIDTFLKEPLKREKDLLTRHNGIDILQTQDFIKVYCETYLHKILKSKTFSLITTSHKPLPMSSQNSDMKTLETSTGPRESTAQTQLQSTNGFKYRTTTGELIFALVTCRADIAFPVMKLTQFNNDPAQCHFDAIKQVYKYLHHTISEGLYFWRPKPERTLTPTPLPTVMDDSGYDGFIPPTKLCIAHCFADSDWAGNRRDRRSVSGILIMLGGAAIVYKTVLQKTIALSSTEAEFYALSEAGKMILYIRLVLADLNLTQEDPTVVYEDNRGCLEMTKALKPTKRTRHVETRCFAVLNWVQTDTIDVRKIDTSDNSSDVLTKPTGRTIFYRHHDTIMGRRIPAYRST